MPSAEAVSAKSGTDDLRVKTDGNSPPPKMCNAKAVLHYLMKKMGNMHFAYTWLSLYVSRFLL